MNVLKRMKIVDTYMDLDDDETSTERLLALVCDECHCRMEDVINALEEAGLLHDKE